jgi:PqqD family protein of HPr-rel-A system
LADFCETTNALRWRLMPGQLLRARQWDGEFVVYNDLSGDTHLLDSAAMDFLLQLQARAGDAAGVAYSGPRAHDASEELTADLDDVLATLASAFLIECIAC